MMTAFLTLVGIYQENYRPFIPTRRRDETLPRLEDE
jgi:hypothetical protein